MKRDDLPPNLCPKGTTLVPHPQVWRVLAGSIALNRCQSCGHIWADGDTSPPPRPDGSAGEQLELALSPAVRQRIAERVRPKGCTHPVAHVISNESLDGQTTLYKCLQCGASWSTEAEFRRRAL